MADALDLRHTAQAAEGAHRKNSSCFLSEIKGQKAYMGNTGCDLQHTDDRR